MKRQLGIFAVVMLVISSVAFAGPFIGGTFDGGTLDLAFGVNFESLSITGTIYDLDYRIAPPTTVLPTAGLSVASTYEKGNTSIDFGLEFMFGTLGYPVVFIPTGLVFEADATFDLAAALLDTDWTVDAFIGADYNLVTYAGSKVILSLGFYVEMPWGTPAGGAEL